MPEPRILVVDDHPDTLRFFSTFLTLEGFEVTTATDGYEALTLASNGFEAIATDLSMPRMNGAEFIRRMRAVRTKPPVPIIVVTAHADATLEAELVEIGSCGLLKKPIQLEQFAQLLRTLTDKCEHQCDACSIRRQALERQ